VCMHAADEGFAVATAYWECQKLKLQLAPKPDDECCVEFRVGLGAWYISPKAVVESQ
jgi:hypothetical protein